MDYNVRLEFNLKPTEDEGDKLVTALESFSPAAGPTDTGTLDVWITVQASSVRQAIATGLALATTATPADLLGFEVIATAEFDRRQGITPVPDLIGTTEAAEILGISRQAVDKLVESKALRGHRVGERTIVLARQDVVTAAAARGR